MTRTFSNKLGMYIPQKHVVRRNIQQHIMSQSNNVVTCMF